MIQRLTTLACLAVFAVVSALIAPQSAWADAATDLTAGRAALSAGELEKSLPLLSSASQALPASVEAQLALAECHLRLGQLDKALDRYRAVLKLSPDHAVAKKMVQSLTGAGGTFKQRLAAATALVDAGMYSSAESVLVQLLAEASDLDERQAARLQLVEARLWSGNNNGALADAVRLIHESTNEAITQPARIAAALALVHESQFKQAEEYLKAAGKPTGAWASRAEVAAALIKLVDRSQAADVSNSLLANFASIPVGDARNPANFRQKLTDQAFGKLLEIARQEVGRGDIATAVSIVWPMVAKGAAPGNDAVLNELALTGGWLNKDDLNRRSAVAQLLVEIGKTEVTQNPGKATLWGFWVGAQVLQPLASQGNAIDQLLRIAAELPPLSRPATDRKAGQPLSVADEVQRAILLDAAEAVNFEGHRQQIASQIVAQWDRYSGADDLATGIARFVTVELKEKPAKIVWAGALARWQAGPAHQQLLTTLGVKLGELGQKQFNQDKATLAADAGKEINEFDQMALVVLGHAAAFYPQESLNSARALAIVERYADSEQWPAATMALNRFYAVQAVDVGRWTAIQQKIRQAIKAENSLLAVNRQLDKVLNPLLAEALKEIAALLKSDTSKSARQTAINVVEPLVTRYAGLERYDLSEAVIAATSGEIVPAMQDWALWARANLLHRQATRKLAQAAAVPEAGPKLTLDDSFKAEIALLDELIAKFPQSTFVPSAVQRVQDIATMYQNQQAFEVALSVLDGFLKTHAKLSVVERMEFRRIDVLLAKANLKFNQRKDKTNPPTALLAEHTAALDALAAFLKAHPTGSYAERAESTMLAVARMYGTEGAWPIVRQVLARYAAAVPDLRQPSRMKLLEAATYLGELDRGYGLSLLVPLPRHGGKYPSTSSSGIVLAYDDRSGIDGSKLGLEKSLDDLKKIEDELAGEKPRGEAMADAPAKAPPASDPKPGEGIASGGQKPQYNAPTSPTVPLPSISGPGSAPNIKSDPSESSLAMIRQSQSRQYQTIAMLEGKTKANKEENAPQQQAAQGEVYLPAGAVLSKEEMARQDVAADKAYAILLALVKNTDPAEADISTDARNRLMWLFGFFEGQQRADRASLLIRKFIADHPTDPAQRALAYQAINDQLTWAAQMQPNDRIDIAWLEERHKLFEAARAEIKAFLKTVAEQPQWIQRARMLAIESFDKEAALASRLSTARAGGLLVQGVAELLEIQASDPDHCEPLNVPQRLWNVSQQLSAWHQEEMANYVLGLLPNRFPTHPLAMQAVLRIAQLHAHDLSDPLKALDTYLEYISLAGDNESIRANIFQMAQQLSNRRRYLEAIHVYSVFVDSFPSDNRAPLALNAIGQTHQTNEAWTEALKAYQRIIDEYPIINIVPQVKLSIAECHIHRSEWKQARKLYDEYLTQYPGDGKQDMLRRRNEMLKTLDRYQTLLADTQVSRNKDDAQFQIGRIVMDQLNLPTKALEEFGKVVKNFPKSDLADDAQLEIGKTLIALGRLPDARSAFIKVPELYPNSSVADDALFLMGQTYEQEAAKLASVTPETAKLWAFEQGQRGAYSRFNESQQAKDKQQADRRDQLRKAGKQVDLDVEEASSAAQFSTANAGNISNSSRSAEMLAETESAVQVANRQDRINEAYREAVASYVRAAKDYPLGDKTDQSLLRIAQIFETQLKDRASAMETYQRIVKLFPGTPVAEDAAWKVAQFHEQEGKYTDAATAYREFIRNYPGSTRVADAQFALAEVLEQLGRWIDAMDAYETFRQKFAQHPKALAALEQINWIKAYRK